VKEKATKPRIVVIVPMYITALECNDGVAVPGHYQWSSCVNARRGNTLIMISKRTMITRDRAVNLQFEISLSVKDNIY